MFSYLPVNKQKNVYLCLTELFEIVEIELFLHLTV